MYYAILSDWDEPLAPSVRVCVHDNPKETALEEAINNLLNLFVFVTDLPYTINFLATISNLHFKNFLALVLVESSVF